ncbi:hypothetical protein [Flavobacterium sp.]|uniref:hypothetical protein n=1 Tax=Flavobacterium sp. TaxID=239 RepID=UPI004048537F
MRKFFFVLFFMSLNVYSQFKIDYAEIKLKYRNHDKNENYFEVSKIINQGEYADFTFLKKDSSLVTIHLKKLEGYTEEDFKNITNDFIVDYNSTMFKAWENWNLYYDEKNKVLLIKIFNNHSKEKIESISITNDSEYINNMLPLFTTSH